MMVSLVIAALICDQRIGAEKKEEREEGEKEERTQMIIIRVTIVMTGEMIIKSDC